MSANAAPPKTAVRRPRSVNVMIALYLLVATAITAQQTVGKARSGNYAIFRAAFGHLRNGLDLYAMYPAEQLDYYKYSPTAALMLAPFSVLPYGAGLWLWNLLNAGVLCASIVLLLPGRAATGALLIVLLEAVGAIQNTQVNALLAGLMIFALVDLQRGRIAGGAGVVAIGAAIKVFPLAAGALWRGVTAAVAAYRLVRRHWRAVSGGAAAGDLARCIVDAVQLVVRAHAARQCQSGDGMGGRVDRTHARAAHPACASAAGRNPLDHGDGLDGAHGMAPRDGEAFAARVAADLRRDLQSHG
jgi:hypothetical protein